MRPTLDAEADARPKVPSGVRVVVIDDHELVREGVTALLDKEPDLHVIGEAENAAEGLKLIETTDPDVVVLDYRLPDGSGVELCRDIAERRLRARIVVLSAFLQEDAVYGSLMAGASAYVVKDVEASELKQAVRVAARGGTLLDPKVAGHVISWAVRFTPASASSLPPSLLTVLRLLCQGRSNEEISEETGLTPLSVKKYVSRLYRRLGVSGRAEAATEAHRRGLI